MREASIPEVTLVVSKTRARLAFWPAAKKVVWNAERWASPFRPNELIVVSFRSSAVVLDWPSATAAAGGGGGFGGTPAQPRTRFWSPLASATQRRVPS